MPGKIRFLFVCAFALFVGMSKSRAEIDCGACVGACHGEQTCINGCLVYCQGGDPCTLCIAGGGGAGCCIPCGTTCGGGGTCTASCDSSYTSCGTGYERRNCTSTDCSTYYQYKCATGYTGSPSSCSSGCSLCTTGAWGAWSAVGVGCEGRSRSTATCGTESEMRCSSGYYQTGTISLGGGWPPTCNGCTQCPDSGASAAGSTAVTQCYVTAGGSDATGNYNWQGGICYYSL